MDTTFLLPQKYVFGLFFYPPCFLLITPLLLINGSKHRRRNNLSTILVPSASHKEQPHQKFKIGVCIYSLKKIHHALNKVSMDARRDIPFQVPSLTLKWEKTLRGTRKY
ncbi:putative actin-binding protein anillin-like [Sesbania bispinosa]|nr:putative actin-binding protein anillin-like [Sesbania bispinosa]